jgi:hypothetical protein
MAERDPEFMQDVLRIVHAALSDREALAAALAGQPPMPVPDTSSGQTDPLTPPAPHASLSPLDVGVQGGAPGPIPPPRAEYCGQIVHVAYEDLYLGDSYETGPNSIAQIQTNTGGASREQVMQELMREALRAQVAAVLATATPPAPTAARQARQSRQRKDAK